MANQNLKTDQIIEAFQNGFPELSERLTRELLMQLHRRGLASIDTIYDEARALAGEAPRDKGTEEDPNVASTERWEGKEREAIRRVTARYAGALLTREEVEATLNSVRKLDEAATLEGVARLPEVPFAVLADHVHRYCSLPQGDGELARSEMLGIRVSLIRNFISDQLEFIGVAKNHVRIRDFDRLLERVIGPDRGQGKIGGKAAGMLLGYRILQDTATTSDDPAADVHLPESWFLRSDVIQIFLQQAGLNEYQNQKYKDPEEIRNEYPLIRQVFQNSEFPSEVVTKLDRVLEEVGDHPLIVRSSSLLEDRFGAAFSGMYASIFVANQGPRRERLRKLIQGIVEVYASTLGPDPLLYRRRHNLVDYNEEMAILIQKVVGRPHGPFLLPDFGGMSFSRNEYRWSSRIRPEDGMARVVLGLGTRAVDRTGNDYPRMVALGAPQVRPEVTPEEIVRYSQREVDVIDLEEDRFRSVPLADLRAAGADVPGLDLAASVLDSGTLIHPTGALAMVPTERLCLTFDRLLGRTPFAAHMRDRLRRIQDVYEVPVNLEFAQVDGRFYLLQCRPLIQIENQTVARIPGGIPDSDRIFSASGIVRPGLIDRIDYLVYVDPRRYDSIGSRQKRLAVARAVGRINDALEGRTFVLMGPGRWGTNNSRLGVKVSYADISHCRVLVEIALRKGEFVPEVSYGTHFFQDLVEDGIFYLALYPDEGDAIFNDAFLQQSPNELAQVVPRDAGLAEVIKVIRLESASPGRRLTLAMDGDRGEALCWLE